jgi:hypothetical protein
LPWNFGDTRIAQDLHGGCTTEGLPILKYPDELFVSGHFDKLGALPVVAARGENGIAVGQPGGGLRSGTELVICRQFLFGVEFPDRLSLGIDFAREAVRFIGNESIAVLETDGGPRRFDGLSPYFVEVIVVFHDIAHPED